jgi:hypothetical protein
MVTFKSPTEFTTTKMTSLTADVKVIKHFFSLSTAMVPKKLEHLSLGML